MVFVIALQVMSIVFLGAYLYPKAGIVSHSAIRAGAARGVLSNVHQGAISREAISRGPISGCTANDLKKRPNVVLLLSTNTEYVDMTMNLLESIKRIGLCLNTSIVADDEKASRYLLKKTKVDPAIHLDKTAFLKSTPGKLTFWSKEYHNLVNKRHSYILARLEQGFDVLYADVDTFWFRDPFSYFEGNFDMSFVDERSPYPQRLPKTSAHCAGLGYFKRTNKTIQFVKKWIDMLADKRIKRSDQGVLNDMLHKDIPVHVDVRPLPVAHFPHALVFYKPEWRKQNNYTIIHHAVGIRGHDTKVQKFKESNMWLVGNFTMDE